MERARPTEVFPRWSGPIARPEPDYRTQLAALRHQGWTLWYGRHTRQYWAAHTGLMRLVCADTPGELLHTITRSH